MMWDKELEAKKILAKEIAEWNHWQSHKQLGVPPTPIKRIGYSKESVQQGDYFAWAVNSYPDYCSKFLVHVPNEGDTGGEAGRIKGAVRAAMGVTPGFPDFIFILIPILNIGFINSVAIELFELKLPGETLNKNQIIFHEKMKSRGISITIGSTFDVWRRWIEGNVSKLTHFLA